MNARMFADAHEVLDKLLDELNTDDGGRLQHVDRIAQALLVLNTRGIADELSGIRQSLGELLDLVRPLVSWRVDVP